MNCYVVHDHRVVGLTFYVVLRSCISLASTFLLQNLSWERCSQVRGGRTLDFLSRPTSSDEKGEMPTTTRSRLRHGRHFFAAVISHRKKTIESDRNSARVKLSFCCLVPFVFVESTNGHLSRGRQGVGKYRGAPAHPDRQWTTTNI